MNSDNSYVLGIQNVPPKWSLKQLVQKLTPILKRPFTALQFGQSKGMQKPKVAYLRFPREVKLDLVLFKLKNVQVKSGQRIYCMHAFIPTTVPEAILQAKGKGQDKKMAHKFGIAMERPEVTCTQSLYELFRELQMKYIKLYSLSAATGHRLLDAIAHVIFDGMAEVIEMKNAKKTVTMTNFSMTKAYRYKNPHRNDYEMVMSTIHRIEDELGQPRTQLTEKDLFALPAVNQIVERDTAPTLNASAVKILGPIIDKVLEYINQLDTRELPQATADMRAALQVRRELKKQMPYIPEIIRDTVMKYVAPRNQPNFKRVKIFGEPFMPSRETVMQAIGQILPHCSQVRRCLRLYNCLLLSVQTNFYPQFLKMDGMKVGAATLRCRPCDVPIRGIPESVLERVKVFYGLASKPAHPGEVPGNQARCAQADEWEGAEQCATGIDHRMEDVEFDEEDIYQAEEIDFEEIDADVEGEAAWT